MNRQKNICESECEEGKVNKHSHDIMLELRLEAIAYIAKSE